MLVSEIRKLSEPELKELALQKNKKGNATSDAKKAQEILWKESGYAFGSDVRRATYGTKFFASADTMCSYK